MKSKDPFLRPLVWVAAVDLGLAVSVFWPWTQTYEFAEPGSMAALMTLRAVVWIVHLRALLGPVRAWQRQTDQGELDDETVLAADNALQRLTTHFVGALALGWVLAQAFSALLSSGSQITAAQQATAVLSGSSVVLALPALVIPALRNALFDVQAAVARDVVERSLRAPRTRRPLAGGLVLMFVSLASAAVIGLGGMVSWTRVEGQRALSLAEQQRLAELDASRIAGGLDRTATSDLLALDDLPAPLRELASDEPVVAYDTDTGQVMAAAPLGDGRWVLSTESFEDDSWRNAIELLITCVLAMVPALLAAVTLARVVTIPLRQLDEATRQIARTGALRTRGRVGALQNDEVGDVAANFNHMLDVFEELAEAVDKVAKGDLRVELERPGDLQDGFRAMLANLDEAVVQIRSTALEVGTAATSIQARVQELEDASGRQATSLREVGATVSSLAHSAESITNTARGVLEDAEQTRTNTDAMVQRITEFSSQAAGVAELLDQIGEIAQRSDLLALNGSLEAVRAGDAGRGFALVAAEMRRLAERVTGTVTDVSEQLAGIRVAGASTEAATERSRELAENTAKAARKISQETRRQGRSTELLVEAVHGVVESAATASTATTQTRAQAEGLRAHADSLERLTRSFELRGG
ncbi:Frizzy aggregation protein FrzCD [Enhygromyxa salina]|uniref:Frizzy aggregation protein FrzCD n=1 Tax=Enhygromyxa salina TaxID=215803 RepID=A0A2S9YF29_9BACT|nr:methyl-accepting chemotaxis protein [Enhygromyxa salina]PRQ03616.1 Frizzy aggregation protein FrzCD [Enhygromyxa salina]